MKYWKYNAEDYYCLTLVFVVCNNYFLWAFIFDRENNCKRVRPYTIKMIKERVLNYHFIFQGSQPTKRNRSSASSTASSSNESPQKSGKKNSKSAGTNVPTGKKSGAVTRSRSASSATSSGSETSPKKSSDKKSKKSKKDVAPRAVPKKSATAKPIAKPAVATKKQLSDNDSGKFRLVITTRLKLVRYCWACHFWLLIWAALSYPN